VQIKKISRVRKPLDAVAVTVRNIELFKRNLEALKNNQFELVNTNLRTFADKIEESNKNTVKLLSSLNNNLNKFSYKQLSCWYSPGKQRSTQISEV